MARPHLVAYGLIAAVTPVLVLVSSMLGPARMSSPSVRPFQLMAILMPQLLQDSADHLRVAYILMARPPYPQARIVAEQGHYFLEVYQAFNIPAQTPRLILVLERHIGPQEHNALSDQAMILGQLPPSAGMQRYPIPDSVEIRQYLSVVIWCPDLDAILDYAPLTLAV